LSAFDSEWVRSGMQNEVNGIDAGDQPISPKSNEREKVSCVITH
jgi:hypothetical protein